MYCHNCGSRMEDDARFCSTCGTPVYREIPQSAENRLPEGGGSAPPEQAPYAGYESAQVPWGVLPDPSWQNKRSAKKPMSKKTKGLMWGGIGLAAALVIAAVLLFVVFAGGVGPLSGNTVQTRFVNESVKLFAGAFADFAVLRTADVSEQPFDMEFSLKTKGGGLTTATEFEMAYDRLNLGASVDAGIVRMKMLMLEDKLYVDSGFGVAGVQLESDTDLTKPMGLKQRLAALSGSENEVDTIKLVEAFVNSISEDCFRQTGNAFVLQLSATDLQKTLKAFANRLDDDPKLRDDMESLLNGMDIADMEQVLENAASALDVTEFDLTIMIGYRGGAPTAFDIEIESAGSSVEMDFGYEKKGDATIITMGVGEGGDVAEIELTVRRIPSGLELVGSVEADDALFDIKGSIEKAGNTLSGSFDLSDGLEVGTLAFEYTVKPGMPRKAVEDDMRFAIDIENAVMQNIGDLQEFPLPPTNIIENWQSETTELLPELPEALPEATGTPETNILPGEYGDIGVLLFSMPEGFPGVSGRYYELAEKYGVDIEIQFASYDAGKQLEQFEDMVVSGVDALIIEPSDTDIMIMMQSMAKEMGVLTVFIGTGSNTYGAENYVTLNFYEAGRKMGDACPPGGDVCVIGAATNLQINQDMENGLLDRLTEMGCNVADRQYTNYYPEEGEKIARSMMKNHPGASAIVCMDQGSIEHVMAVLSKEGYQGKLVAYVSQNLLQGVQAYSAGLDVTYVTFDLMDLADNTFFLAQDLVRGIATESIAVAPYFY